MTIRAAPCCGALLVSLVFSGSAASQSNETPSILQVPATVRTAGFNGAGVALVGDAGSIFINPAGMATIRRMAVEGSYRPIEQGTYLATGALAWRIGQFDVGLGGRYFDLGQTSSSFAPVSEPAYEALGVGSLIYRFGMIAIGGSGKYYRRRVGDADYKAVSMDAGIALAFFDIAALAFSIQNVGGNWIDSTGVALARVSRLGFTMNYVDPLETVRLLSTFEVQWVEGRQARAVLGAEAGIVISGVGILARTGYAGRTAPYSDAKLTVGATLTLGRFLLDYGYVPDDLNDKDAHMLGLRLTF